MSKKIRYIDEAGDPNFFGKGKVPIIGTEGVSNSFILGMISFKDKNAAEDAKELITSLCKKISNDKYYKSVPSVKKRIEKYGSFIPHAKDDIPEN